MPAPFHAELIVEPFLSGKRIDTFLMRHFRNYSSYRVQRIVRAGEVRINDVLADNDARVYRGQCVSVRLIEPPDKLLPPTPGPLEILLVPHVGVAVLVHAPIGVPRGYPVPLGFVSFDETVLRRTHEYLLERIGGHFADEGHYRRVASALSGQKP